MAGLAGVRSTPLGLASRKETDKAYIRLFY
jgi:hypothetical protein